MKGTICQNALRAGYKFIEIETVPLSLYCFSAWRRGFAFGHQRHHAMQLANA